MHPTAVAQFGAVLLSVLVALGQHAGPTTLRQVDWSSVLAVDPALTIETSLQGSAFARHGPYVRVVNGPAPAQPWIGGFALLDDVQYGDIDGDGQEEAAIMLDSGGTAGVIGLLVYHADAPRPRLAAVLSGYKMGARIENGALVVVQPEYAGFEPNCCPSAEVETDYALQDELVPIASVEQPLVEAQSESVQQFYMLLDQHALSDAYAFLSDGFQQSQPFDAWSSGYATTERVQVDDVAPTDDGVRVAFTATDRDSGIQHFAGTWRLVWGPSVHHWLLDSASIAPVP